MSIFIAIIIFGIIILVHEAGHFVAARKCGIWVTEFAIGMGPKLIGIKRGETLYTIRLLPIGGFCLMYGDDADAMDNDKGVSDEILDKESLKDRALNSKPVYQRLSVMFAGSFMNFVLAFVLLTIIAAATGIQPTTLSRVVEGSPAEAAGLAPGDRIISLNGRRIFLWADISFEMDMGYGRPVEVGFVRDGRRHTVTITPAWTGHNYMLGVGAERRAGLFTTPLEGQYRVTVGEVLVEGIARIEFFVRTIIVGLIRLVTAQLGTDQMVGPIGIVNMIGGTYQATIEAAEVAQASRIQVILSVVLTMANFAALISANLGVINLLPLPALDGGRIMFLIIEAIRRKPIPPEREGVVHLTGFVLLMLLAVFLAYQDIMNLL